MKVFKLFILAFLFVSIAANLLQAQTLKDAMKPAVKNGGFKREGYILWCPTVIKVGDTYHMFASSWPEQYGLGGWTKYSEIIRATSKNLYGPYKFEEVVIQKREGKWDNDRAHNPKIVKAGNKYVLYYISSANETGYAYADAITGPWTRVDSVAMPFSNPAPLVRKDGSVYVFGRKAIGNVRIAQGYEATAFNATYKLVSNSFNLLPDSNQLEDPTIWWASNQYNVILNDFNGDATGVKKAGTQYYSTDGIHYNLVSKEPVFTKTVNYDDGSSTTFRRRERPFVYVNEKGKLTALFTACLVEKEGGKEQSWIEVQPIDNYVPPQFAQTNARQYSQLWGRNGERWDTTKIPDFTNAGYKQGKIPIPVYTSQIDVTKLGAIGDGKTDNTKAFRDAIRKCKKNQAVYIPAGTYWLTDSLVIGKSNICIRGEGAGKTKLFFSKGLEELYPDYNVHYKNQTQWSWGGAMILFNGNISDCGIENLSVEFPDSVWTGHNFHERAYDGIGFADGAHDGWIKNVTFINADMGIWIERSAHHITAEGWLLDFGPNRGAQQISGHHGVNIYGGHNLLQNFELKGKYQHDLSVESEYSVYNVFRNGKGTDICIDHHNHAQSHNLFTNIDAGIGSRIYASGGIDTPRGVCFHETFWNIRAERTMLFCNQYDTMEQHSTSNVCVGVKTSLPSQLNDAYGNWFEAIDPLQLYPADLYKAQMERKKSKRK